ncbi:hypothetical protein HAV15_007616 [Penicillium sp. str. |nr:hypothetical protein HAV15_007616 [Penicillium sp. str. \
MLNTRSMRQDLPRLWPGLPEVIGSPVGRLNLVDRRIGELRDGYGWDQWKGTVVDVGGGSGHISISLAQERPLAIWTIRHKAEQNPLFLIFKGWNTTFVTNVAT